MRTLINKINDVYATFQVDCNKNIAGNKSAGVRARKISLELGELFKEYRKKSVENDKA